MKKGPISKESIISACILGIQIAQTKYLEMSGDWVCWAPEYFITSCIAQKISKQKGGKYVTLENSAYDALSEAGALGRGKLHKNIRSNGRFDILLWWGYGQPRAIIEVKNRVFNKTQYESDLKRISSVLNRKADLSSIRFGIFCFFTAANNSTRDKGEKILEKR